MWDNDLFYKAVNFASLAHLGQTMKHVKIPYMAHFMSVTALACKYATMCKDINWNLLICTSVLHDTLEDTSTTYEQLLAEFGEDIASGVLALTKNKHLPKDEQIADSVNRIMQKPKELAIIKMADRMFNVRDIVPGWDEERCKAYKKDGQLICDKLGHVCPELKHDLQAAINKYLSLAK